MSRAKDPGTGVPTTFGGESTTTPEQEFVLADSPWGHIDLRTESQDRKGLSNESAQDKQRENQLRATREVKDESIDLARRTRDAFQEACEVSELDESEIALATTKQHLENLWKTAPLRDRPFRDLLGLIEVAVKGNDFSELSQAQRDAIRLALCDLPKWMLDDEDVEKHIDTFAEVGIDILAPIRTKGTPKMRITFEEIKE